MDDGTSLDEEEVDVGTEELQEKDSSAATKDKRQYIIDEIVETEEAYLRDLYTLLIFYIQPLLLRKFAEFTAKPQTTKSGIPKGDVKVLFSTVELLFEQNNEFMNDLREEVKKDEPLLGSAFLKLANNLTLYALYCNHQRDAMETLAQTIKTSSQVKQFLDQCREKSDTKGLSIMDYLVKPFQRFLKYPLLLTELVKNTPPSHADYASLKQALQSVQTEVSKINADKAKNDNFQKMLDINEKIDDMPKHFKLLLPGRVLLKEGSLRKITKNFLLKNKGGLEAGTNDQERHFFLFNDCLIYCKKRATGGVPYQFKGVILLSHIRIDEFPEDTYKFKIFRKDKNLEYILYGDTPEIKRDWVNEIKSKLSKLDVDTKPTTQKTKKEESKKEIFKVYFPATNTSKTLALPQDTLARDVLIECAKKQRDLTLSADEGSSVKLALIIRLQNSDIMVDETTTVGDLVKKLAKKKNSQLCCVASDLVAASAPSDSILSSSPPPSSPPLSPRAAQSMMVPSPVNPSLSTSPPMTASQVQFNTMRIPSKQSMETESRAAEALTLSAGTLPKPKPPPPSTPKPPTPRAISPPPITSTTESQPPPDRPLSPPPTTSDSFSISPTQSPQSSPRGQPASPSVSVRGTAAPTPPRPAAPNRASPALPAPPPTNTTSNSSAPRPPQRGLPATPSPSPSPSLSPRNNVDTGPSSTSTSVSRPPPPSRSLSSSALTQPPPRPAAPPPSRAVGSPPSRPISSSPPVPVPVAARVNSPVPSRSSSPSSPSPVRSPPPSRPAIAAVSPSIPVPNRPSPRGSPVPPARNVPSRA